MMMAAASMDQTVAEQRVELLKAGAPKCPPAFKGIIMKQATNFFAEWQLRTFECRGGRLRYWQEWTDCGVYEPRSEFNLLGAKIAIDEHSPARFNLSLNLESCTRKDDYCFMSNTNGWANTDETQFQRTR